MTGLATAGYRLVTIGEIGPEKRIIREIGYGVLEGTDALPTRNSY
jgi:hypothetical protein